MKVFAVGAVFSAACFLATPLVAQTQDAENKALVRAGCLAASDTNPAKLKKRTAIRCFQKALGADPTGTLTRSQQQALLDGKITASTPSAPASTAPGGWSFENDTARYYDPKTRVSIVLSCYAEQLKLTSIATNVRAGSLVKLTLGGTSFEAVVDKGHVPMRKSVPATFTGRYDQHLERLMKAARAGGDLQMKWPTSLRNVSSRGLADSLSALEPLCRADADVDLLLSKSRGDQRLYDAAWAKRPSGLPSLTEHPSASEPVTDDRKRAWEAFGFEFREVEGNAFVASIQPDSPAAKRGLRVGDVVGGDSIGGFKGGGMQGLHRTMAKLAENADKGAQSRPWTLTLNRPSAKVTLDLTIPAPNAPASEDDILAAQAPSLPPTFRKIEHDATMIALWRHQLTSIDTPDKADAVMRTLFAVSYHVKACYGPNPAVIPFQIVTTEVERNDFGIETNREVSEISKELRVRPEFEAVARRHLRSYSDSVRNERFVAVRDLISQHGCGRRLQWLEAGLAKAAGVTLDDPVQTSAPAFGDDWRGFVASCLAATYPDVINAEANAARLCNIVEAVLVEMNQPVAYEAFKAGGITARHAWSPADKATFDSRVDELFRGGQSEIRERGEIFVRDAGLF